MNITRWHFSVYCGSNESISTDLHVNSIKKCQQTIIKPRSVSLKPCNFSRVNRTRRRAKPHAPQKKPLYGYSQLLNFAADGSTHHLTTSDADHFLDRSECTDTQIYNPFERECIETTCPRNQISMNGQCVTQQVISTNDNESCVEFQINYALKGDFTDLEEEEFKEIVIKKFLARYHLAPQTVIPSSGLYNNFNQCPYIKGFASERHVWSNASDDNDLSGKKLQTNVWTSGEYLEDSDFNCSKLSDNATSTHGGTLTIFLKHSDLNLELGKSIRILNIGDRGLENDNLFSTKISSNNYSGYGCLSSANLHNIGNSWCDGFQKEYFGEEFEVLTGGNKTIPKISGIRIFESNKTYKVSQFQYTTVFGNGTFWKNVTQMATTCDVLPRIKKYQGFCLKMPINTGKYELLSNRSIRIRQFEQLSEIEIPFKTGKKSSKPNIQSVFNLDEYEYLWHQNPNSSQTFSINNLTDEHSVSICMPLELLEWLIEIDLWNSVSVNQSCEFLQELAQGSGIAGLVFSGISMCALIVVLFTYSIFRSLRTLPGISLMNLVVSIMLSQTTFLTAQLIPSSLREDNIECFIMAFVTHYCTLASFMWMNVMAYCSYRAFGANLRTRLHQLNRKHVIFNNLYGWGIPAVIVTICVIIDYTLREKRLIGYGVVSNVKVYTNENATTGLIEGIEIRYRTMSTCWIANSKAAVVIFGIPLVFSMVVNLVLFIRTCIGKTTLY